MKGPQRHLSLDFFGIDCQKEAADNLHPSATPGSTSEKRCVSVMRRRTTKMQVCWNWSICMVLMCIWLLRHRRLPLVFASSGKHAAEAFFRSDPKSQPDGGNRLLVLALVVLCKHKRRWQWHRGEKGEHCVSSPPQTRPLLRDLKVNASKGIL